MPSLQKLALPADTSYWPAVAEQVEAFARAQNLPLKDMGAIQVVVTQGSYATALRSALHVRAGGAFMPPRMRLWGELAASDAQSVVHRV